MFWCSFEHLIESTTRNDYEETLYVVVKSKSGPNFIKKLKDLLHKEVGSKAKYVSFIVKKETEKEESGGQGQEAEGLYQAERGRTETTY